MQLLLLVFRYRGFVDPNTGENLSYKDLLKRTLPDVVHGKPMIVIRQKSLSNKAEVKADSHKRNIEKLLAGSLTSTGISQRVSLDDIEEAQVFKPDIMERLRDGKIDDDEIDILMPAIVSKIEGKSPIVGVYDARQDERMNFISAVERQYVRGSFARDLLEAQAACGTILNVETG